MDIRMEEGSAAKGTGSRPGGSSHAAFFRIDDGETVHVLHPQQIVAFQGHPSLREDRLMKISGMYRKKKLIKAEITGPSEFMMALPTGFFFKEITIEESAGLLFEFRHILFYSKGIQMSSVVQSFKNALVTKDLMKMKFSGTGTIGILSHGPVYSVKLKPDMPLFVDSKCLLAVPEKAKLELSVYGNHLASQHMNYHWKITGDGIVLLQTYKSDPQMEEELRNDGLVKRVLREVIPFGGVFMK